MASGKWRDNVEIAGFVTIVISIVLLGYEIRQNTLAVQATALQQHFEQHTNLLLARLDNPALLATIRKAVGGIDGLTNEDINLYGPYTISVMRNHFVAFELVQSGLLPESQWRTFRVALEGLLTRSKGARDLWTLRRERYPDQFSEEFIQLVEAIIADADRPRPGI